MKVNTIEKTYKPISFKDNTNPGPINTTPSGTVALPAPISVDMPQFSMSAEKKSEKSLSFGEKIIKFFKDFAERPSYNPLEYRPGMTDEELIELGGLRVYS